MVLGLYTLSDYLVATRWPSGTVVTEVFGVVQRLMYFDDSKFILPYYFKDLLHFIQDLPDALTINWILD